VPTLWQIAYAKATTVQVELKTKAFEFLLQSSPDSLVCQVKLKESEIINVEGMSDIEVFQSVKILLRVCLHAEESNVFTVTDITK
jgi:hypothetical protein